MAPSEAVTVHALHTSVLARTPAGMVRPDDLAHFEQHAQALGRIIGGFVDDTLVAYGVLGIHSPTAHHLAELLELDPARRARICVLDGAASLPEWRGRSLHCGVIAERGALAMRLGRSLVSATVAPANLRSLRGLLKEGYTIHRYALVYGGMPRLIVMRDLLAPPRQWRAAMLVDAQDHAGHQQALAAGMVGYACSQDDAGAWLIEYGQYGEPGEPGENGQAD